MFNATQEHRWSIYCAQAQETPAIVLSLTMPIVLYVLFEAVIPVVLGLEGLSFAREQFQTSADMTLWRQSFFFSDSGISESDIQVYLELGFLAGSMAGVFVLARVLLFLVTLARIVARLIRVWTTSYTKTKHSLSKTELTTICQGVAVSMGVDVTKLEVRDEVSFNFGATIRKCRGKIVLLIPLGTQHLGHKDPTMLQAIVAHEFGHVHQGDVRFWDLADAVRIHLTKYYNTYVKKIADWGMALLWLSLMALLQNHLLLRMILAAVVAYIAIGLTVMLPSRLFSTGLMKLLAYVRRRSEHLADTAASIVAGEEALARALSHIRHDHDDIVHPSPEDRLAYIRDRARNPGV
jgi:Zn-dependent protease with chaperone function